MSIRGSLRSLRVACFTATGLTFVLATACKPSDASETPGMRQEATNDHRSLAANDTDEVSPRTAVRNIAAEYAKLGFEIDIEGLTVSEETPQQAAQSLDRHQIELFPPQYYVALLELARVFAPNLPLQLDPATLRKAALQQMLHGLAALYIQGEHRMVLLDNKVGQIADLDSKVVHELAHAWQDQHTAGIQALFARGHAGEVTVDSLRARQLLLEGHAELMATAIHLERAGRSLEDLEGEAFDNAANRLLAGETALLYSLGARYMLEQYARGGWPAVHAALEADTISTEQLLHPNKRDADVPTVVELPTQLARLGLETIHATTIGEFAIYLISSSIGMSALEASKVSAGWDGDRMFLLADEEATVMLWRTVWDRPADAEQFSTALKRRVPAADGHVHRRRDHVVDIIRFSNTNPKRIQAVQRAIDRSPLPPKPSPSDGASTLAIEEGIETKFRAEAQVVSGVLYVPAAGVRIPIPEGWQAKDIRGVKAIANTPVEGFSDVITIQYSDNTRRLGLDAIERESRAAFERMDGTEIDSLTRETVAGYEMLVSRVRSSGGPPSGGGLRIVVWTYLRAGKVVNITAVAPAGRWPQIEPIFQATFEQLRIDP